ncbi:replication protein A 70 kDa DNA-binding subunit A-like [Senna tora]|uniref:Replication protein A 70 kDa DNA-binding subunit A-like n=1 Tax=Senna tora TaxID=362788 RepID=A0A834SYF5_9FABA|nr:replication protein A 70 kDa DNA-binding subunit A-like [Senna tora]
MAMENRFDSIRSIHALSRHWTIKARVVRLWSGPPNPKTHHINPLRWCFVIASVLKEGSVYVMSQFNPGSNSGGFRVANHSYKLNFQFQTRVAETDDDGSIPRYGFEFILAQRIFSNDFNQDILVGGQD